MAPATLRRLGYEERGEPSTAIGLAQACEWQGRRGEKQVDVTVWTSRDYFVDTYRNRLLEIFVPTMIAGAPAVVQQSGTNPGSCVVTVGVADSQTLDLIVDINDLDDAGRYVLEPCAEGRRVAEVVLSTLPPL